MPYMAVENALRACAVNAVWALMNERKTAIVIRYEGCLFREEGVGFVVVVSV